MLLQRFHRIIRIILAADSKNNSAVVQIEQGSLKFLIGASGMLRSQLNAGHPILSDYPSPKSVVEIDDYGLRNLACERMQEAQPFIDETIEVLRCDREANHKPLAFVMPLDTTITCY